MNRVLPPLRVSARTIAEVDDAPVRETAQLHRALYAGQQEWLTQLPPGPHLPYLFGLLTPGEVAAQLADVLEAVS